MLNKMKTDYMGWIFLIGIVLLFLEISFKGGGLLFALAFSVALIYLGRKYTKRTIGKILFFVGLISLIITVLNMFVFKFFLMAILICLLLLYYQSKKNPDWINPIITNEGFEEEQIHKEPLLNAGYLFQNKLFGHQQTGEHVYEWNSVNVQIGVGDTVIDLSRTILPKGDAVISLRNIVGNITVLIPYGIEIRVHHSVMAGRTRIFENKTESRVFNQIHSFQTEGFDEADHKVHIITSILVGDLEVKRV
ncbi:cell wall-active antibiotics response protein [Peribacillus muralis]|uniref:cell wall-active antibiotics response protein LiaF n=1 Tax=Peribacillus muralis TaxID=264697 RepID=UPI001F4D9F11|nr:cell wall-active antibiotics response protein LiaF [Peribacillus muralis]MCK1992066.1 cell wall-active antibiotics response protein LiaF [Peribacillus muralis]MCK2012622.1 cell wall-active antibiotics response protein LiaF [Peribacillus muralis]